MADEEICVLHMNERRKIMTTRVEREKHASLSMSARFTLISVLPFLFCLRCEDKKFLAKAASVTRDQSYT
jgi:hypothetical protein